MKVTFSILIIFLASILYLNYIQSYSLHKISKQPPPIPGSANSSSNSNTANTLSMNNAISIENDFVSKKRYGGGISRTAPPSGSSSASSQPPAK